MNNFSFDDYLKITKKAAGESIENDKCISIYIDL